MSNGGRADGPLVLWSFGLNGGLTGGRERDGGFKYFDNDLVHADDHVDDGEDYLYDDDHVDYTVSQKHQCPY